MASVKALRFSLIFFYITTGRGKHVNTVKAKCTQLV